MINIIDEVNFKKVSLVVEFILLQKNKISLKELEDGYCNLLASSSLPNYKEVGFDFLIDLVWNIPSVIATSNYEANCELIFVLEDERAVFKKFIKLFEKLEQDSIFDDLKHVKAALKVCLLLKGEAGITEAELKNFYLKYMEENIPHLNLGFSGPFHLLYNSPDLIYWLGDYWTPTLGFKTPIREILKRLVDIFEMEHESHLYLQVNDEGFEDTISENDQDNEKDENSNNKFVSYIQNSETASTESLVCDHENSGFTYIEIPKKSNEFPAGTSWELLDDNFNDIGIIISWNENGEPIVNLNDSLTDPVDESAEKLSYSKDNGEPMVNLKDSSTETIHINESPEKIYDQKDNRELMVNLNDSSKNSADTIQVDEFIAEKRNSKKDNCLLLEKTKNQKSRKRNYKFSDYNFCNFSDDSEFDDSESNTKKIKFGETSDFFSDTDDPDFDVEEHVTQYLEKMSEKREKEPQPSVFTCASCFSISKNKSYCDVCIDESLVAKRGFQNTLSNFESCASNLRTENQLDPLQVNISSLKVTESEQDRMNAFLKDSFDLKKIQNFCKKWAGVTYNNLNLGELLDNISQKIVSKSWLEVIDDFVILISKVKFEDLRTKVPGIEPFIKNLINYLMHKFLETENKIYKKELKLKLELDQFKNLFSKYSK